MKNTKIDNENKEIRYLTTQEAADYLRLNIGTVRNMISKGEIKYYKIGRKNLFLIKDLNQLIKEVIEG